MRMYVETQVHEIERIQVLTASRLASAGSNTKDYSHSVLLSLHLFACLPAYLSIPPPSPRAR